jgi:hypothetical protein
MSIRIATKTLDITPTSECSLGGNGVIGNFETIESNLEANIFLINENNLLKLFLTFDLLYVGEVLSKNIRKVASKYVADENIWISASHTHNAPMTDGLKPKLGIVDTLYLDHVSREISKAIKELFEKIEEATTVKIVERIGKASVGTYRRRRRPLRIQAGRVKRGDVYMGPNPWKKIDRKIKRLDFVSENGDLLGVMWNFACHPVSHPGIYQVSAHFPGEVRSALRRINTNLPVLFLQGFAGDIRPKSISGFREYPFRTLKNGPEFRLFSRAEYFKFCRKISNAVVSAKTLKSSSGISNKKSLRILHASKLYIRDSKTSDVRIQIMPLGGIYLLGISAEPSSDLLGGLAPYIPTDRIWFCGYLEDVFGYFPTQSQLSEGGYEASGFQQSFDCGPLEEGGLDAASKVISDYFAESK